MSYQHGWTAVSNRSRGRNGWNGNNAWNDNRSRGTQAWVANAGWVANEDDGWQGGWIAYEDDGWQGTWVANEDDGWQDTDTDADTDARTAPDLGSQWRTVDNSLRGLPIPWGQLLPYLGKHQGDLPLFAKHQLTWTKRDHWTSPSCLSHCGHSCGCCRAANPEDWGSGCEACVALWYCKCVDRQALGSVTMYDGVSDIGREAHCVNNVVQGANAEDISWYDEFVAHGLILNGIHLRVLTPKKGAALVQPRREDLSETETESSSDYDEGKTYRMLQHREAKRLQIMEINRRQHVKEELEQIQRLKVCTKYNVKLASAACESGSVVVKELSKGSATSSNTVSNTTLPPKKKPQGATGGTNGNALWNKWGKVSSTGSSSSTAVAVPAAAAP
jgi:hypothetical protein